MTGLREHHRDVLLLERAGEGWLRPRSPEGLQLFLLQHMLLRDSASPVGAELSYARWKPGTSLVCVYAVAFADGTHADVVVKRHRAAKAASLVKQLCAARQRSGNSSALRAAAMWGDDVVWVVPSDPQLDGLARVLELKRAKRWLAELELCPGLHVRSHRSHARLLRYRPETRAVVKWDLSLKAADGTHHARTLAVRALPVARAARIAQRRQALGELACLPTLIAHEDRTGLLLEEWLDVRPQAPDCFTEAHAAGVLLGQLHAHVPMTERTLGTLQRASNPRAGRESLHALLGWRGDLAILLASLPQAPPAPAQHALRWTHGDVHPDQFAGDETGKLEALLDLDRVALGDYHEDLASWIADHMSEDPVCSFEQASSALLEGHAHGGGPQVELATLRSAVAEALVHRAAACMRRMQVNAEQRAAELLHRGLQLASQERCAP